MKKELFHTAESKEIKEGKITDVYFLRAKEILEKKGINPVVKAEIIAKELPLGWKWGILAGIEELANLLEELPINVRAMDEGSIFFPGEPVVEIEGKYLDFCIYETSILGLLCQSSGIATKSARLKKLAGERLVISFGARRMHPSIAPMIERSAFIGGCDGVAVVKSAKLIGEDPMGTMPHALILILGSTASAVKAFDEIIKPEVKRVALIDTFQDEKFEAINIAEEFGEKLYGIRLDTPPSRRGDFKKIIEEVRWELSLRGKERVKIFVSGGIDEKEIIDLNDIVDAYGVGTSISNAPVIDFSLDIVEIERKPISKRGKFSGSKRVLVCKKCGKRRVVPNRPEEIYCECGLKMEDCLLQLIEKGDLKRELPEPVRIKKSVIQQINKIDI
ncbi:MAG: nicotinate phosphoribosyltransferase [Candidatus Aminicenantia bacterium]